MPQWEPNVGIEPRALGVAARSLTWSTFTVVGLSAILATDEEALIGMVFGIYSRHGLRMLANFLVDQVIQKGIERLERRRAAFYIALYFLPAKDARWCACDTNCISWWQLQVN
jgi:hypothetical protein